MKILVHIVINLFLVIAVGEAVAQNKVVVVPLGGDTVFQVKSGQVLTGQISRSFPAGTSIIVVGDSFPAPLPASTPVGIPEYTTTTSSNCPGIGSASSGYICIYGYQTFNIDTFDGPSGSFSGDNRLYGFSVDFSTDANAGFILASWAYKVP